MNKNRTRAIITALLIVLANIAIDQYTKQLARENLQDKGTIKVVGTIFVLVYAENEGGFLSLGSSIPEFPRRILLTWLPTAIMAGMLFYLFFSKTLTRSQLICLATILGGGVSNLMDRFIYDGHVTDFMNFGVGGLRTGILNVADLSITFGAIALLLLSHKKQVT
jgi:signal peptidase II